MVAGGQREIVPPRLYAHLVVGNERRCVSARRVNDCSASTSASSVLNASLHFFFLVLLFFARWEDFRTMLSNNNATAEVPTEVVDAPRPKHSAGTSTALLPSPLPLPDPKQRLHAPCAFDIIRKAELQSGSCASFSQLEVTPKTTTPLRLAAVVCHPHLHAVTLHYLDPLFVAETLRLVSSQIGQVAEQWLIEESIECAHPDGQVILPAESVQQLQRLFWGFNMFRAEAFIARCPSSPNLEFVGFALDDDALYSNVLFELPAAVVQSTLRCTNSGLRWKCLTAIRQCLIATEKDPAVIDKVFKLGVLPDLVQLVAKDVRHPAVQVEAVCIIDCVFVSNASPHINAIVNAGALQPLMQGAASPHGGLREGCVRLLTTVVKLSESAFNALNSIGIIPVLATSLGNYRYDDDYARRALHLLSQSLQGRPPPSVEALQSLYPILTEFLTPNDEEVAMEAWWALTFATNQPDIEHHCFGPKLFATLRKSLSDEKLSVNAMKPVVRFAGNAAANSNRVVDMFINAGCLDPFVRHLDNSDTAIVYWIVWGISNIAAGTIPQQEALMKTGCMTKIIPLVSPNTMPRIFRAALWALTNATHQRATAGARKLLVEIGVVEAFLIGLRLPCVEAVRAALSGLGNIFRGDADLLQPFKATLLEELKAVRDARNKSAAIRLYECIAGECDEELPSSSEDY